MKNIIIFIAIKFPIGYAAQISESGYQKTPERRRDRGRNTSYIYTLSEVGTELKQMFDA